MNIEYKDKYIKYKNKYLLTKQTAGLNKCDLSGYNNCGWNGKRCQKIDSLNNDDKCICNNETGVCVSSKGTRGMKILINRQKKEIKQLKDKIKFLEGKQ